MTSLLLDLRHARRVLTKNLGTTIVSVFTLALAIGAATAIFSVVYGVLLRPLPYPQPDRLMAVVEVNHRGTYSASRTRTSSISAIGTTPSARWRSTRSGSRRWPVPPSPRAPR